MQFSKLIVPAEEFMPKINSVLFLPFEGNMTRVGCFDRVSCQLCKLSV